uniref:ARAD1D46002p n=1 Tax=Blastobotrys adeninivorans TaxID=409370 RepID=A0A060TIE9_BLAAD
MDGELTGSRDSSRKRPFVEAFIDGYRADPTVAVTEVGPDLGDSDPLSTLWLNLHHKLSGFEGQESFSLAKKAHSVWNFVADKFSALWDPQTNKRIRLGDSFEEGPDSAIPSFAPIPAYARQANFFSPARSNPIMRTSSHSSTDNGNGSSSQSDADNGVQRPSANGQQLDPNSSLKSPIDTPTRASVNTHTNRPFTPLLWSLGLSQANDHQSEHQNSPLASKISTKDQGSHLFVPETTPGFKGPSSNIVRNKTYGTSFSLRRNSSASSAQSSNTILSEDSLAKRLKDATLGSYEPNPTVVPNKLPLDNNATAEENIVTATNPFIIRSKQLQQGNSSASYLKLLQDRRQRMGKGHKIWQKSQEWSHQDLPDSTLSLEERREWYKNLIERHNRVKKAVEELKVDEGRVKDRPFKALPPSDVNKVHEYWSMRHGDKVLVSDFKIDVTVKDLKTLRDQQWLNDNVIDFYLALVSARSQGKSFAFSTHFYSTLEGPRGYDGVARWAKRKKVDVTKLDYVFVPINRQNTHWCLAVVNNVDKRFEFYDSMGGNGRPALELLREYMILEADRLEPDAHSAHEKIYNSYDIWDEVRCPQQENGYDCGVFTCKTVEVLARNCLVNFSQKDMPAIRRKMAFEIVSKKLMS